MQISSLVRIERGQTEGSLIRTGEGMRNIHCLCLSYGILLHGLRLNVRGVGEQVKRDRKEDWCWHSAMQIPFLLLPAGFVKALATGNGSNSDCN